MIGEPLTRADEEALLRRTVEPLLTAADRARFAGTRCLITGAGGSIGSEIARQIAGCGPALLTLVDHSEQHLFEIERELAERWPGVPLDPVLADITRPSLVNLACTRAWPQVVFHAAAYKHVTMAERAPCAAASANVLGTSIVLAGARAVGARFVLISSDKAARPHSVMGATKRLAELVTIASGTRTFRTAVVRFGNVLASSGSFVTIAQDCIRRGRPIPVTDPEATRYFMTVDEAASLVMKADALARGGETFWLDMGSPVRIGDLVDRLLDRASRCGYPRVSVRVVGLRAGEKRDEELTTEEDAIRPTIDPRIWVAPAQPVVRSEIEHAIRTLRRHVGRADGWGTIAALARVVREYTPSSEAWAAARRGPLQDAEPQIFSGRLIA